MSQDLLSKFDKLSDREILIALCSQVDNLCREVSLDRDLVKRRIDNHSIERDEETKAIYAVINEKDSSQKIVNKSYDERFVVLEREKSFHERLRHPAVLIIIATVSGWLAKHLPF